MKVPTMKHVIEAIKIAEHGGEKYKGVKRVVFYDQSSWCGTSCCVWGHALLLAGNKKVAKSNSDALIDFSRKARVKFMEKSLRHRALGRVMVSSDSDVLPVLRALTGIGSVERILKKSIANDSDDIHEHSEAALVLIKAKK